MDNKVLTSLDENTRRYYLETMGVQCWELKPASAEQSTQTGSAADDNRDVDVVDWQQLETSISQCALCELHKSRDLMVVNSTGLDIAGAGIGNQTASLMFVVLAPDSHAAFLSEAANVLFEKMLKAINISMSEVYMTSLLKCPVPNNHAVTTKEIATCKHYLKLQLQWLKPKRLIVLGETAAQCLLQKDQALDLLREDYNNTQQIFEDVSLFLSYSPAELILQADNKRKAWADLQQLQKLLIS